MPLGVTWVLVYYDIKQGQEHLGLELWKVSTIVRSMKTRAKRDVPQILISIQVVIPAISRALGDQADLKKDLKRISFHRLIKRRKTPRMRV